MTFLLDTNIVSELWKPEPAQPVLQFVRQAEWWLPLVVIAEIQEGAERAASMARRGEINARLDAFLRDHSALIVPWNAAVARTWGRLAHSPEVRRQPQALWDSLIDAMAVEMSAAVATRNRTDFRHARTFDPFVDSLPA
ncbi:MAG: type II toxin-antitoxin system VapC family toxin [Verrucomicrobiae bacterium]|nr:type II toxin-antitoxin system VapC family toxin [Verrucomicrobiae bacterium]